ncbi:hypothetical protein MBLNU230_g1088t1 [Neophaeotheca triangularis]
MLGIRMKLSYVALVLATLFSPSFCDQSTSDSIDAASYTANFDQGGLVGRMPLFRRSDGLSPDEKFDAKANLTAISILRNAAPTAPVAYGRYPTAANPTVNSPPFGTGSATNAGAASSGAYGAQYPVQGALWNSSSTAINTAAATHTAARVNPPPIQEDVPLNKRSFLGKVVDTAGPKIVNAVKNRIKPLRPKQNSSQNANTGTSKDAKNGVDKNSKPGSNKTPAPSNPVTGFQPSSTLKSEVSTSSNAEETSKQGTMNKVPAPAAAGAAAMGFGAVGPGGSGSRSGSNNTSENFHPSPLNESAIQGPQGVPQAPEYPQDGSLPNSDPNVISKPDDQSTEVNTHLGTTPARPQRSPGPMHSDDSNARYGNPDNDLYSNAAPPAEKRPLDPIDRNGGRNQPGNGAPSIGRRALSQAMDLANGIMDSIAGLLYGVVGNGSTTAINRNHSSVFTSDDDSSENSQSRQVESRSVEQYATPEWHMRAIETLPEFNDTHATFRRTVQDVGPGGIHRRGLGLDLVVTYLVNWLLQPGSGQSEGAIRTLNQQQGTAASPFPPCPEMDDLWGPRGIGRLVQDVKHFASTEEGRRSKELADAVNRLKDRLTCSIQSIKSIGSNDTDPGVQDAGDERSNLGDTVPHSKSDPRSLGSLQGRGKDSGESARTVLKLHGYQVVIGKPTSGRVDGIITHINQKLDHTLHEIIRTKQKDINNLIKRYRTFNSGQPFSKCPKFDDIGLPPRKRSLSNVVQGVKNAYPMATRNPKGPYDEDYYKAWKLLADRIECTENLASTPHITQNQYNEILEYDFYKIRFIEELSNNEKARKELVLQHGNTKLLKADFTISFAAEADIPKASPLVGSKPDSSVDEVADPDPRQGKLLPPRPQFGAAPKGAASGQGSVPPSEPIQPIPEHANYPESDHEVERLSDIEEVSGESGSGSASVSEESGEEDSDAGQGTSHNQANPGGNKDPYGWI